MKAVRRVLAVLLGLAIAAGALALVADATVWNQTYLNNAITATNFASTISADLPAMVTNYAPDPISKTAISDAVTPTYIGHQLQAIVPEFVAAYRHDGPRPSLNLTDISQQFAVLNVAPPASLQKLIDQPVPLFSNNLDRPLRLTGEITGKAHQFSPLATLALLVIIIVVAGRRRWTSLAAGAFTGAIITAIVGLICLAPPGLIDAALTSSIARPLAPAIRQLTNMVAHDQLTMLIKYAVGLAVAGMLLLAVNTATHMRERFHKDKLDSKPDIKTSH